MLRKRWLEVLTVFLLGVACGSSRVRGDDDIGTAADVLQAVTDRMTQARSLSVKIDISTIQRYPHSNLVIDTTHLLEVCKPREISFITTHGAFGTVFDFCCGTRPSVYAHIPMLGDSGARGDDMGITFVSDGREIYVGAGPSSSIGYLGVVGDVAEYRTLATFFTLYGVAPYKAHGNIAGMVLYGLLSSDPIGNLTRSVPLKGGRYVGTEDVRGVKCHSLQYDNGIHLFVRAEGEPLLSEIRTTQTWTLTQSTWESTVVFTDWKLDLHFPEDHFDPQVAQRAYSPRPTTRNDVQEK